MHGIIELSKEIWQVDLEERGIPGWTSGYFIKGEGNNDWMLVETGAATSAPRLINAAKAIGISPDEVRYIAVSHIHIDHAGGLGVVSRYFKNAEIWVHPRGKKHLVNPGRLIEVSRTVYGEKKMQEYGEVLPVPEERLLLAEEGKIIRLGERLIEIWETPGHARHHVSYYDRSTKGLFSGDAAGVYAPRLSKLLNLPVTRPATPGPDFNGDLMLKDLYRIAFSEAQNIYYTHFGAASPAQLLVELVIGQLLVHMHMTGDYLDGKEDNSLKLCQAIQEQTKKVLSDCMAERNIAEELVSNEMRLLLEPLNNSADGLILYLQEAGSDLRIKKR